MKTDTDTRGCRALWWLPLSSLGSEGGCLRFLPDSHSFPHPTMIKFTIWNETGTRKRRKITCISEAESAAAAAAVTPPPCAGGLVHSYPDTAGTPPLPRQFADGRVDAEGGKNEGGGASA